MKIKTFGYYAKQGLHSISKNKMMSLASISTVIASLLILGIYFITVVNVNSMVTNVESGVEVQVFLTDNITNNQMSNIETEVKKVKGVSNIEFESKQQALEKFREDLGENGDLVADIDAEKVMPKSYIIEMEGPQYVDGVVQILNGMDGIDKINDARSLLDKLMNITSFVRTLGICLMVILLIVAIFLISNTIKLTVFARKREIGIMKYIGATDWFIRWPFVIEGMLLGLIGSVVAGIILGYGYIIASDSTTINLIIKLVEPIDIIPYMAAIFLALGLVIGSLGSMLSMRKFLHV